MAVHQLYRTIFLIIFSIGFIVVNTSKLCAQTYGLKFKGHEETLDKRTELNLTPEGYIDFHDEFEVSFNFKNNLTRPFGYVFRIISEDNHNIDLLSTPSPDINLNIVIGKSSSIMPIEYPDYAINNWINLRIKFLLSEDRLIFYTPDTFYVEENIGFKKKDSYKIIFGANDFKQFKTSDVPSMNIKDVKIFEKGKLKYHWPLDEKEGNIATDRLKGREAILKNPSWLMSIHQIWQTNVKNEIKGQLLVSSDAVTGNIYMVGNDELFIYSANDNSIRKIKYQNKPLFLTNNYKSIFNNLNNRIYCYLVDKGPIYSLDIDTGQWDKTGYVSDYETNYRHHNSFFNSSNNSIYAFGGYGQHRYNNEIRKIDLTNNIWEDLATNDTIFPPRYLSGLGSINDTIYILGGYGSATGNQMINPHSYFDLLRYSISDNSLTKKFEIPVIIDDMSIANSMWINEPNRSYYALVFEKTKFDGYLQLIKGNLDKPDIEMVGGRIPFKFLDIRSYAGLFHMPKQNKLFAYTSYYTGSNTTQFSIFSINYPPNKAELIPLEAKKDSGAFNIYIAVAFVLLSVSLLWYYMKRKKKRVISGSVAGAEDLFSEEELPKSIIEPVPQSLDYQLIFFGGFQVYNKDIEDITSKFSPLLKELFLLIWLNTFKNNKGISSEKLTEYLWYDKSESSARNNRAVNIAKLKTIINEVGDCELTKKTGYWKIINDNQNVKSDYNDFLQITRSKSNLSKQKINRLIEITQKGAFLLNVNYEWLDDFKADVSDRIIDTLVVFAETCDINNDAEFIIHLADCIFNFDKVNEEAMILKCKAQHSMGKHSMAKQTYGKFVKEYQHLYDQEYKISFPDILK